MSFDPKQDISLAAVQGSPIKHVVGYVSTEFGMPLFSISRIEFEDGSSLRVDGEHDIAYIDSQEGLDNNKFNKALRANDPYADEYPEDWKEAL